MEKALLKQIMIDQKELYLSHPFIKREYSLEENLNYCFTGIRRTGKSYMMFQSVSNLVEQKIPLNQIVYINFEDERFIEFTTQNFNDILEIALEFSKGKNPFLFLDEIQNVLGWEKFVRRLADVKYRVFITGSNSKMLSKEIASTLGGRFMITDIYPYSFSEYLLANGKSDVNVNFLSTKQKAEILSLFSQYLKYGAFPELVEIKNKKNYLANIYQIIYLGDIITKNKITNDFAVRLILKKIAETVCRPVSFSRITNVLKATGLSIGKQTVINYIGYMQDSYLLFTIKNYASKLADKESSPKYYFIDTGLLDLLLLDCSSSQLENLVAVELARRYGVQNIFYYEDNVEIDFYIPNENLAIQVCMSLESDFDTKERETRAFVKFNKFLPNTKFLIITLYEENEIIENDVKISVMPAWKWLLDK